MTALFIRRPVLAFVINTLITVAGLAAFFGIEIRELPDVDRPVITVRTDYSGASAESIDREVTAIIEGAVARVNGVKAISSSSQFGDSRVTVEFGDGVDLDETYRTRSRRGASYTARRRTQHQLPARDRRGRVLYKYGREATRRLLSAYAQTIVRTIHERLDGKV